MGKQYSHLLGDTHCERRKEGKKGSFNFLLFKLLDNNSLLEKSLMVLDSILFLESFLSESFSSFKSLSVGLMVVIDLLHVFIFL